MHGSNAEELPLLQQKQKTFDSKLGKMGIKISAMVLELLRPQDSLPHLHLPRPLPPAWLPQAKDKHLCPWRPIVERRQWQWRRDSRNNACVMQRRAPWLPRLSCALYHRSYVLQKP